jgi:hypothetical protein
LRGAMQALAGAVVGALLFRFEHRTLGSIVLGVAGVILLAALASPGGLYAAIERGFAALGQFVGRALTWILMPAVFYGFFFPFGMLFRRGRRDSMKRFYEPDAPSYWSDREVGRAGSSASRQY